MSDSPKHLLLEALEKRWKTCRAEFERCKAEFSNEAVHDVRVALRRLLSLIRLLHSIEPRRRLRKLSRALKDLLDEFDDLRDTQVMLTETSETVAELPELKAFQSHLEEAEKRLLRHLRKRFKKLDLKEVARRIRKTRESLKEEEKADWSAPVLQSVDDAYLTARQRHARVDPAQPASIHRVRVAFKKFRYMVEIIHPMLEEFPEANLKRMNKYQTLMGEIQDAEVFLQALTEFQDGAFSDASLPPGTSSDPARQFYEARHAEAISAYLNDRDALDDFWRLSPEEPFPWEKPK